MDQRETEMVTALERQNKQLELIILLLKEGCVAEPDLFSRTLLEILDIPADKEAYIMAELTTNAAVYGYSEGRDFTVKTVSNRNVAIHVLA